MLLSDLVAKRASLVEEHSAITKKAQDEKRTKFSAEELKRMDEIEVEVADLDASITRMKKAEEMALRGASYATTDADAGASGSDAVGSRAIKPGPEAESRNTRVEVVQKKDELPFRNVGENLQAIARVTQNHFTDYRMREQLVNRLEVCKRAALGQNEAVDSEGGFLLHPQYGEQIMRRGFETGVLASRISWVPLTVGNRYVTYALKDDNRATGSRGGGVRIYMGNEADAATKSKVQLREVAVDLKKMIGLYYATEEILEDAPALGAELSLSFEQELGFTLDNQIFEGDGVMQLKGFMNGAAKVQVAKENGQAAGTFLYMNAVKMLARSTMGPGLVWIANKELLPQLATMSLPVGTGGVAVFIPGDSATNRPNDTLLGYPLLYSEQCEALGTAGDICLVDMGAYLGVKKGGVRTDSSIHVQFLTGESTFRIMSRVGGKPWHDAVITPFKGSNTIAPFITLQSR